MSQPKPIKLSGSLHQSRDSSLLSNESLFEPASMDCNSIDENFANSKQSFTGLIKQYWPNIDDSVVSDGNDKRPRCRLTLITWINDTTTARSIVFLCDEWAQIMHYFWNVGTTKNRENIQISMTLYGVKVIKLDDADCDPLLNKNIAFYLDKNTPNSNDIWIEFKSCVNRICGRCGIRLTKNDIMTHLNGNRVLNIKQNQNINYLRPKYPYRPLSELVIMTGNAHIYGFITFVGEISPCRGKHNWSQQIRVRDASLPWDCDDLQIMIFGNDHEQFPNCRESDLIRIHRFHINIRPNQRFQGVIKLDSTLMAFIVIDGNLTIANNAESVKHSSSSNFTFDPVVDGFMVKYLKQSCCKRQQETNPDLMNIKNLNINKNMNKPIVAMSNAIQINKNEFMYLSEIKEKHERINLIVMIIARLDIPDDIDGDVDIDDDGDVDIMNDDIGSSQFEFHWVIWDGSDCAHNKGLFKFYEYSENEDIDMMNGNDNNNQNNDDDWKVDISSKVGTKCLIRVSPEYEMAVQSYNDISVGCWVELSNILLDKNQNELIYDCDSKIFSKINFSTNKFVQQRMDLIYYNIQENENVITHNDTITAHHKFQSFTPISSINRLNTKDCKFRIRGKVIDYKPKNIQNFTRKINDKYEFLFMLIIKDSSGQTINVLLEGNEAKILLGIKHDAQDLTIPNSKQLQNVGKCMEIVMNKESIIDLCIRSYKVKGYQAIAYKAFDTVLIQ